MSSSPNLIKFIKEELLKELEKALEIIEKEVD